MLHYNYDRRFTASESPVDEFQKDFERVLRIGDRQIRMRKGALGGDDLYINFFNLPKGVGGAGGGAEAENNRMMFRVEEKKDGKVKIEHMISALPRTHKLRAKTGKPGAVAKYLADFLAKVVKEVEPKFTHTKR